MLYPPQVAIITPQDMNIEASIYMVVMVALGGRGKLWGAVLGALDFFILRSSLSSGLSRDWNLVLGLIAVCTVLFLPDGLSGLWSLMERRISVRTRHGVVQRRNLAAGDPPDLCSIGALGLMPRDFSKPIPIQRAAGKHPDDVHRSCGAFGWRGHSPMADPSQRPKASWQQPLRNRHQSAPHPAPAPLAATGADGMNARARFRSALPPTQWSR